MRFYARCRKCGLTLRIPPGGPTRAGEFDEWAQHFAAALEFLLAALENMYEGLHSKSSTFFSPEMRKAVAQLAVAAEGLPLGTFEPTDFARAVILWRAIASGEHDLEVLTDEEVESQHDLASCPIEEEWT